MEVFCVGRGCGGSKCIIYGHFLQWGKQIFFTQQIKCIYRVTVMSILKSGLSVGF